MYKANYKDVKTLIDNLENNENVKHLDRLQAPMGYEVAYFKPASANWSYTFRIANIDDINYELLVRFGQIVGARRTYLEEMGA